MKSSVLFLAHGSPMNAINQNSFTKMLSSLQTSLENRPDAIVVVSPHWLTSRTRITSSESLKTIHDFGGFPESLYQIQYSVRGLPSLANQICDDIQNIQIDKDRGLDHGSWSILRHIWPRAEIPILQISINENLTWVEHFNLAAQLKPYRHKNILFICSGNVVHNLREISWNEDDSPDPWAIDFQTELLQILRSDTSPQMFSRILNLKDFKSAQPSDDHFLPLIYFLGLLDPGEKFEVLFDHFQNRNISMLSLTSPTH